MASESDGFILEQVDGEVVCRDATEQEGRALRYRDPNRPLRVISPLRADAVSTQQTGLKIMLRGTTQLDGFPEAVEAFKKAAANWEARIQTPITVVVDVDFGPTRFGDPYSSPNILGSTDPQRLRNNSGYPSLRNRLIAQASDQRESSLYGSLPPNAIATDLGNTTSILTPASVLRAVGEISATADPASEGNLGPPPSIGFNSAIGFDFDPSNSIDSDKIDFDAVAVHELGHALGFSSNVGRRELSSTEPISLSLLDLFRFRPGITEGGFGAGARVLSSGGEQIFFAGTFAFPLSTGRSDGTGGDSRQASHWKDDSLGGSYIGIMDPTLRRGIRSEITETDMLAFDSFGYQLKGSGPAPDGTSPSISRLVADLTGDVLTLSGSAADADGDITLAQVSLLDSANQAVGGGDPFAVSFGTLTTISFNVETGGLNSVPTALKAQLVLIDARGRRSAPVTADFSQADAGGPTVKNVSFSGSKITVKGKDFRGQLQLEVNGLVVATRDNTSNKKAKINGTATQFNLRGGANRVRVRVGTLRSNIFVFTQ